MVLHRSITDMQPHDMAAHAFSLIAIGGAIAHWLPTLAVIPPALYYTAMFLETKLVRDWLHKRRVRSRHRRIKHARRNKSD